MNLKKIKEKNKKDVLESEKKREAINRGFPLRINISTTNRCNLNCVMCKYHGQTKIRREDLPLKKFREIAEEFFPYCEEVHPVIDGEPFLSPYFYEIVSLSKKYQVRLNIATNGMLLNDKISKSILPILRDIKFSFDGARKKSLESIRRGVKYKILIEKIENFVKLRNKYVKENKKDLVYPTITLQTVLMNRNIKELPQIVRLGKKMGIDRVKGLNLVVTNIRCLKESTLINKKQANKYLKKAKELAKRYGLIEDYPSLFDLKINLKEGDKNFRERLNPPRCCDFLWRQICIEPNGNVRACCHINSPVMGNIFKQKVSEIWNNQKYQDMRKRLDSEEPYICCKHCPMMSENVVDFKAYINLPQKQIRKFKFLI